MNLKNFKTLLCLFVCTLTLSGKSRANSSKELLTENLEALAPDFLPSEVIHWQVTDATTYEDGYVQVNVYLETEQNFSLYSNQIFFSHYSDFLLEGVIPPKGKVIVDPISEKKVTVYEKGLFQVLFQPLGSSREDVFQFNVKYLGCTNQICLFPYVETLETKTYYSAQAFPVDKLADFHQDRKEKSFHSKSSKEPPTPKTLSLKEETPLVEEKERASTASTMEEQLAFLLETGDVSFFWILLIVLLGGLLTNLTPCVYPMIPITMRILANQSNHAYKASSLYALGIMLVYTGLGVTASMSGGMFGQVMANSFFNILISCMMFILAFTMMGFANFSFLQNWGMKLNNGRTGLVGVFMMGAGAGFIASPCTGPILAALITYAVTLKSFSQILSLFLCYSLGFSFPYIFLGSFSSKLSKIKVSPKIQTHIKTMFASIMVALGFYYLRVPFYTSYQQLASVWHTVFYVSLSISVVGFFLLRPQNSSKTKTASVLLALFMGVCLFSAQRWAEESSVRKNLSWMLVEEKAFDESSKTGSPILIDMWAEWCEACKEMDESLFSNNKVIQELKDNNWVLLRFDLTQENEANAKIQEKYGVKGLPTLIIVPNGDMNNLIKIRGSVSSALFLEKIQKYSHKTSLSATDK